MTRSKSSKRWLREHAHDPYVRRAHEEGYRSRAAFKLLEIQERDRLLRAGMTVLDLGAAPGGWSQVAARIVGPRGRVIATDLLGVDAIPGVEFVQGDFREDEVLQRILASLGDSRADLVISDMAPNISGTEAVDQPRALYLAELALELACETLRPGGNLLVKLFQGQGFDGYVSVLRSHFGRVQIRKPKASRPRSREVYVLARNYVS